MRMHSIAQDLTNISTYRCPEHFSIIFVVGIYIHAQVPPGQAIRVPIHIVVLKIRRLVGLIMAALELSHCCFLFLSVFCCHNHSLSKWLKSLLKVQLSQFYKGTAGFVFDYYFVCGEYRVSLCHNITWLFTSQNDLL